jgi:pyridoxal 5'-phosphate synthase pdxT subunit
VLALQGAFREHVQALERLGAAAVEVRTPAELDGLDGLMLPGGESTTMDLLLDSSGLREPITAVVAAGLPVFGTCAGLILLANELEDGTEGQQTTRCDGLA